MGFQNPAIPSSGAGQGRATTGVVRNGNFGFSNVGNPGVTGGNFILSQGLSLSAAGVAFTVPGSFGFSSYCQAQPRIQQVTGAGITGAVGLQCGANAFAIYRAGTSYPCGLRFAMLAGIDAGAAGLATDAWMSGLVDSQHFALTNPTPGAFFQNIVGIGCSSVQGNLQLIHGANFIYEEHDLGIDKTLSDVYWFLNYEELPGSGKATITVDYWAPGSGTKQRVADIETSNLPQQGAGSGNPYLVPLHEAYNVGVWNTGRAIAFTSFYFDMPNA